MPRCYLGLGSNLNYPKRQLNRALQALQKQNRLMVVERSQPYLNPPMGVKAQPMFYNMVICIETSLSPHALLKICKQIEQKQKRIHKKKWGSRTIDIDILFYGKQTIQSPALKLPHPEWYKRDFVRIPLLELMYFTKDHATLKIYS